MRFPSAGSADSVVRPTSGSEVRRPISSRFVAATVVAAAGVLFVVLIAVSLITRGPEAGSAARSSRFSTPGLTFTVPATWKVMLSDVPLHYEHVLAYVGTGSGKLTCGADFIPGGGGTCTEDIVLGANSIVVKVSAWDGPPQTANPVAAIVAANPKAGTVVGGLPAAIEQVAPAHGADATVRWTLSRPGYQYGSFVLTAYMKGDVTSLRAQMQSLVSSISLSSEAP